MNLEESNNCLVISGGGALGSFGCGVSEALSEDKSYKMIIGTSTGALQMVLVILKKFPKLREAYLNVTQKCIFNKNPFKKDGDINYLKLIWRIIIGKESIGESENLKNLIDEFFTYEDYLELIENDKEVQAVVISMTDKKAYYKSNKEICYEDLKEWIWASANSPLFMSFLHKDGHKWTDGGIKEHIPIQNAIDLGYTDIDVIVHRPITYEETKKWTGKGIIRNLLRILQILSENVSEDDIELSKLKAKNKDVNLNIFYTPYKLTENSLTFDKNKMREWWDLGYNLVKSNESFKMKIII